MKILFVCSGNTCRSPMAEGIYNVMASREGQSPAASAGIYAMPGDPASANAIAAAAEYGADLQAHRAQPVTESLLQQADHVYCMTASHLGTLTARWPQYATKYELLAPEGIPDPFGGELHVYRSAAAAIHRALEVRMQEARHADS